MTYNAKPFKDLSEAEINFYTAIVDSFITVRPAHISVKKAVCPIQSVNILLAFYQEQEDCYTGNFQSEIVWLKKLLQRPWTENCQNLFSKLSYGQLITQACSVLIHPLYLL